MVMTLQYQLKYAPSRHEINLCFYTDTITAAIREIFPDALVEVYPKYFAVKGTPNYFMNRAYLQHMGRNISYNCLDLRMVVKEYGRSRQLFIRIKKQQKKAKSC